MNHRVVVHELNSTVHELSFLFMFTIFIQRGTWFMNKLVHEQMNMNMNNYEPNPLIIIYLGIQYKIIYNIIIIIQVPSRARVKQHSGAESSNLGQSALATSERRRWASLLMHWLPAAWSA